MRVLVALGSFRDTLAAPRACAAVVRGLAAAAPGMAVGVHPLADGGEGTAAVLGSSLGGARRRARVTGPLPGQRVAGEFWWVADRGLALLDIASVVGLHLLAPGQRDPLAASTRGLGELIEAVHWAGAAEIWCGVGGCAAVDAGVGAATALGWRFLDARGDEIPHGTHGLAQLYAIEAPAERALPPLWVLCDVATPLLGPDGTARACPGLRGREPQAIELLEEALANFAEVVRRELGLDVATQPGSGAAGGCGAGAAAFLGARLASGIGRVKAATGFEAALDGVDWVVTGEGRVDDSSFVGKVLSGVLMAARAREIPVAVLAGELATSAEALAARGVAAALSLAELAGSRREPLADPERWLAEGAARLAPSLRR